MREELQKLLQLQVIDYDLGELERSKEYIPDMMENLKREIVEVKDKHEVAQEELASAKAKQSSLELEIKTKEADLQKYQQQMMSIKTNKEYDALVSEIDTIKEKISTMETELLETIDTITSLEKQIEEYNDKLSNVEDNNSKQLSILQEKIDTIGDKVLEKENERKDISASIPRNVMTVYDRVRKGKGGSAVVAVKKRACGACFKALTPKKIQDIKKGNRILTCDNCGRLLFWDGDDSEN